MSDELGNFVKQPFVFRRWRAQGEFSDLWGECSFDGVEYNLQSGY